jgi:hypothetical protein
VAADRIGKNVLDDKFARLVEEVQNVFRLPSKEVLDPIVELRTRHVIALILFAKFFKTTGAGRDVAKQLADLASALSGLTDGIVEPLLRANQSSGRPGDRSDIWRLRVLAANGVECLIRSRRYSRAEAARQAAKKFPELKKLLRPRTTLKSSLLSWRDAVANGRLNDPIAKGMAKEFREWIDGFGTQWSPEQRSEELVAGGWRLLQSASDQAAKLLFAARTAGDL